MSNGRRKELEFIRKLFLIILIKGLGSNIIILKIYQFIFLIKEY